MQAPDTLHLILIAVGLQQNLIGNTIGRRWTNEALNAFLRRYYLALAAMRVDRGLWQQADRGPSTNA